MGLLVGIACMFLAGMELEIVLSCHLPPFSSVLSVFFSYLCDLQSSVGLILSWSKHYLLKFILEDVVLLLP
jgi:hypothetical protein